MAQISKFPKLHSCLAANHMRRIHLYHTSLDSEMVSNAIDDVYIELNLLQPIGQAVRRQLLLCTVRSETHARGMQY